MRERVFIMGERLKTWRAEHEMTQSDAAKIVGVSQGVFSQWENMQRSVSPEHVQLLVNNLGISPDFFCKEYRELKKFVATQRDTSSKIDRHLIITDYGVFSDEGYGTKWHFVDAISLCSDEDGEYVRPLMEKLDEVWPKINYEGKQRAINHFLLVSKLPQYRNDAMRLDSMRWFIEQLCHDERAALMGMLYETARERR